MLRPLAATLAGLIAWSPSAVLGQGANSVPSFNRSQPAQNEPTTTVALQREDSPRRSAAEPRDAAPSRAARAAVRRGAPRRVNARIQAERNGYKLVSSLVNFPRFFPGIGILYVKPETLPHGPFLAFDRKDTLVSTIYMVPMNEMQEHRRFAFDRMRQRGDHVELYYNAGHAGVDTPHYHVVVWHVAKPQERRVAR